MEGVGVGSLGVSSVCFTKEAFVIFVPSSLFSEISSLYPEPGIKAFSMVLFVVFPSPIKRSPFNTAPFTVIILSLLTFNALCLEE